MQIVLLLLMSFFARIKRLVMVMVTSVMATLSLGMAFAQGNTYLDLKAFLTLENIGTILSLFTSPLTSIVKNWFGTEGRATFVVNLVLNLFAKGLFMVISGQSDLAFAVGYFIFGVLLDYALYNSKVQTAEKAAKIAVRVNANLPQSGVRE